MIHKGEALGPRIRQHRSEPSGAASGTAQDNFARHDAEHGSRALYGRLCSLFVKFEAEHGLKPGAGKILLPAGWNGFAQ
jgi:hypothetical protein